MKYNILVGGAAGQGMDTLSTLLEKLLKRKGYYVHSSKDYMSRVRGGHNFIQIRFGNEPIYSHWPTLDLIIALDKLTVQLHRERLAADGRILCDESIEIDDNRLVNVPMAAIAREVNNPKASGVAAAGAALKLMGETVGQVEELLLSMLGRDNAASSFAAFSKGHAAVSKVFELEKPSEDRHILINGNDALALGALAGGTGFFASYPMTPATSIMKQLASRQKAAGIIVEQVEDEISAINMALGASYAGVRAMTATSGGGLALMVEGMSLQGIIELPLVVVDSQRPGPSTGIATRTEQSDLDFVLTAGHGEFPRLVIALRNPQDAFYQTARALNLADKYRILVLLLTDQYLADASMTIPPFDFGRITIERQLANTDTLEPGEYKSYKLTESGVSPGIVPGRAGDRIYFADSHEHDEYGHISEAADVRSAMMRKRMKKLEQLTREVQEPEYIGAEAPELLLLGWGSMYGPLREAVELLQRDGEAAGALVFGDLYPFPSKLLKRYSKAARKLVNVEQNYTGQLARLIRQETGITMDHSILNYDGRQLSSRAIYERIRKEVL